MSFIIASYLPDHGKGKLSVRFKRNYPCPAASPGEICHLTIKSYRPRKTGPCFPMLVCYCKQHKGSFTVYPDGYVPHGRKSLMPTDDDGSIWQAVFDAKDGKLWPESPPRPAVRTSQVLYLKKITKIFGLNQPVERRNQTAYILEVELAQFEQFCSKVRDGPCYRRRWGIWLHDLLNLINEKPDPLSKFLRAGALNGLWQKPTRWLTPSYSQ